MIIIVRRGLIPESREIRFCLSNSVEEFAAFFHAQNPNALLFVDLAPDALYLDQINLSNEI